MITFIYFHSIDKNQLNQWTRKHKPNQTNAMETSPLARLSPEIRNAIYEFTFTSEYAVTLRDKGILHPLSSTCRQLRAETLHMYLALTTFNAHLDDGPALPLAQWLQTLGRERCLLLGEVNIWDMHMLNATVHGAESTQRLLQGGGTETGDAYVLRPIGRQVFHRSWYLKDIIPVFQAMDLGLARFCIVEEGDRLKQTSEFAVLPAAELGDVESGVALAESLGLSDVERVSLMEQLDQGRREVRLLEGRRNIILCFDTGQRLISMRQEFIPREEEFYL